VLKIKLIRLIGNKYAKAFLICIFIISTFSAMNFDLLENQLFYSNEDRENTNNSVNIYSSNGYLLIDPINITTGSDWANYPFITGNGTAFNPYIIENVEIIGDGIKTIVSGNDTLLNTTYVGIYINAGGLFIIRNSKISHTSIGIHLSVGIPPENYSISDVEISDCSIGIYSRWPHIDVNISNCYVHDINWVSIKAKIDVYSFFDYGGVGIWVRSDEGIIENCRIEDCSIGMVAGLIKENRYNEFINCGFVPDWNYMVETDYDNTNTVNGKPIGIFWGINNWVVTNASLYGQLIFASCANLTLNNIRITQPCSIPIQVYSSPIQNQKNIFENIICENQQLGMYFSGGKIFGNNLYAKNCEAGFYFNHIAHSNFTRIMIDNTEVPIYMTSRIVNCTFEIEKSTKFYLVEFIAGYGDILEITPGDDIFISYITELGMLGYAVQFNELGTYNLNLTLPGMPGLSLFTVKSVPRYTRPLDPGVVVFIVVISIGGGISLTAIAYIFFKKRKT